MVIGKWMCGDIGEGYHCNFEGMGGYGSVNVASSSADGHPTFGYLLSICRYALRCLEGGGVRHTPLSKGGNVRMIT